MKKSIKLFATVMVCMAMALCVSCKKDDDKSDGGGGGNTGGGGGGSQTVEMRLSKVSGNDVYYLEGSTDGGQTWNVIEEHNHSGNTIYTWNDNLLSSVKTYYYDDYGYNNYDFRYDNNKLSNVIWTHSSDGIIDTITYDVEYDGDNMSEVTVHYYDHGGHDRRVYHLEYSDGKLSSVTRTNGYNDVCNYFWNGDNISEVRRITGGDEVITSCLSYDDKKNPFYGIDALLVMDVPGGTNTLSKNICTKWEYVSGSEEHPTTETVDYTYNSENYPTQAQAISNTINPAGYHPQYELTRKRSIETVTYEYLD